MILLLDVLWLVSAVAVFGAPMRDDQVEQEVQQFLDRVLAFNKSYDESLESNEITPEEFVKPGHTAEVKPEEVLKEVEIDLNLKVFNKSHDESRESNKITPQEFVKPGHSATFSPEEVLKEIETGLNLKAFGKSYDESLQSNEITPQEFVKPGFSATVIPDEILKEIEIDLNQKAFKKSYDKSLGSNETAPQEFGKPGHSAKVKPEEVLKGIEIALNLKVFNKSYDESLGSNEITPQEFVKPGHPVTFNPKEMLKEIETGFKAFNMSYDESLGNTEITPQELVKPGHSAKVKLEKLLKEVEIDLNTKASNTSYDESQGGNETTTQGLVKPGHSTKVRLEDVFPVKQLKEMADIEGKLKPLNISYRKTPVINYTEDANNETSTAKSVKRGHMDGMELMKMLSLKKLFNPYAAMDLWLKNEISWPHKNKDSRVISRKWKPIIKTRIFMSTEHPDSLQTEEDPVIFYLLHDPHFLGCNYVPVGSRIALGEDLMGELFRPTLYPRTTARKNLRKHQRKDSFLTSNQENLFPRKSDKALEETFKCPEENGFFSLDGHCSSYIVCQNGIPYVNYCPPELRYNPRVKNCDLASKVHCEATF